MEELTTEDVVALVQTAWLRAVGGSLDNVLLHCALESIALDLIEDGALKCVEQAQLRIKPFLQDFPQVCLIKQDYPTPTVFFWIRIIYALTRSSGSIELRTELNQWTLLDRLMQMRNTHLHRYL